MPPFPLFAISNRAYQAAQTAILARSSSTGREQTNTHTHTKKKKKQSILRAEHLFQPIPRNNNNKKKSD